LTQANLRRCRFEDCKLLGIDWTATLWSSTMAGKRSDFVRCALSYGAFIGLTMQKITLEDCVAHEVNFSDADLRDAICTGTDFRDGRFTGANLSGANFAGARNYRIDTRETKIARARFALPEAITLLRDLDIVLED
jgi:uncharacterized protein YjbI with pentapeptide repeats